MKILFEEYLYETTLLSNIIGERYYFPINATQSKITFVGYYFNPHADEGKGDSIIIFPKVFINKEFKAFDYFAPEDLISPTLEISKQLKANGTDKIIFEMATWLYRAIQQFNKRHKENIISENQQLNEVISNLNSRTSTELDIILSLLKFHKDNQSLFTFISKSSNSHQNKVNWDKTINKSQMIIQDNQPFYLDVNSKKKKINEEEELLILFYSTLNYIKTKYDFDFQLSQKYELIKNNQFETLLRRGCRYLKNIKYKYYSDKMLALYNLLYTFFERSERVQAKQQLEEILLIKDFNIVFEDMIDDLIGDLVENNPRLSKLKNHADGKQIDHIYRYKSLIVEDDIYFIGDSKYYKPNTTTGANSKAKQFTYAKNIIQNEINLFNDGKLENGLKYRDNETEGYNITPNFFISAFINDKFDFLSADLRDNGKLICQQHFENRLFDRDTLFVQSYNINFLFVISAYISKNAALKANFKENTRKRFRDNLITFLNEKYVFYIIKPLSSSNTDEFITKYFRILNGKVYKPSQFKEELLFASERKSAYENHKDILNKIKDDTSSIEEYSIK